MLSKRPVLRNTVALISSIKNLLIQFLQVFDCLIYLLSSLSRESIKVLQTNEPRPT